MARILLGFVAILVVFGSIESSRYPPKYEEYLARARSIRDSTKNSDQNPQTLQSKSEIQELGPDLKEISKERREYKSEGPYEHEGEKGEGEFGRPGGPSRSEGPEGPEGSEGPEGPGPFMRGPEGPYMSKRYNPFRSRKPSYRAYLQRMMEERHHMKHHLGPHGSKYPEYTEIVIIRKVPILLSKLLVVAAVKADKKPELEPKPEYPVGPPKPVYRPEPGKKREEGEITLQKEQKPSFESTKGQPKFNEEDKQFEDLMGIEEDVEPQKAYRDFRTKNQKEEGGASRQEKDIEQMKKQVEYLEKPRDGLESNELEGRNGQNFKKEEEKKA